MRLGVETPLSRGVVRKDSVGVREAPSWACWRRTFGTWQVLRGVEGCVLRAGVPPAVVIGGTGRHVARVCWKGETVLEESLTVLAELDAKHMLRQYGSHGSFPYRDRQNGIVKQLGDNTKTSKVPIPNQDQDVLEGYGLFYVQAPSILLPNLHETCPFPGKP